MNILITAFERSHDGGKELTCDTRIRRAPEEVGLMMASVLLG